MKLPKNRVRVQDGVVVEVNIPSVDSQKFEDLPESEVLKLLEAEGWYQVDLFPQSRTVDILVFSQEKPVRGEGFLKATRF